MCNVIIQGILHGASPDPFSVSKKSLLYQCSKW